MNVAAPSPQATRDHPPTPDHLFETVNAYQRTAALRAAIELDLFTAIGEGNATVKPLASRCQASERGTRILCDYLVVIGFLTKDGSHYGLSADSAAFLDRRASTYLGSITKFLNSPYLMGGFSDVTTAVRKGGTTIGEDGTLSPENAVWVEFARSMAPLMARPAELIAELLDLEAGRRWKVLDIAAGHGLFGITIAKKNPTAEIVALDWPNVLEIAKENALAAGLADRYKTIAGSAAEADYGDSYDLVLLTNILHHFDAGTCEKLLRRVHAALRSGGRAVTLEFVPNEDRVSPPLAAAFSLMMLGTTPSGDAYTFAEYQQMFRKAGFTRTEIHPLPPTPEQVLISHKT